MAKRSEVLSQVSSISTEKESFEIIELAINDIETLAKAFNLIAEVGQSSEAPFRAMLPADSDIVLN